MGIPFCEHYLLMTAAPALQVTSSCELVPPEQPIPPTSLPSSIEGKSAARRDDPVEREYRVGVGELDSVLEDLGLTAESR